MASTVAVALSPYKFDSSSDIAVQPDRRPDFNVVRMLEDGFVFDGVRLKYRPGGDQRGSLEIDSAGWKSLAKLVLGLSDSREGTGWKSFAIGLFGWSDRQKGRLSRYSEMLDDAAQQLASQGAAPATTFAEQLSARRLKISELRAGFSIGERHYQVRTRKGGTVAVETTSDLRRLMMMFTQSREEYAAHRETAKAIDAALSALDAAEHELKKAGDVAHASAPSVQRLLEAGTAAVRVDDSDDVSDELVPLEEKIHDAAQRALTRSYLPGDASARQRDARSAANPDAGLKDMLLENITTDVAHRRIGGMTLAELASRGHVPSPETAD